MTEARARWWFETIGYGLIAFVIAHYIGWWVVPLGLGFGLIREVKP